MLGPFLPLATQLGLSVQKGAYVARVTADTPASKAGIRVGDVIVEADGKEITSANDLVSAIRQHRPRATSGGLGIYDPLHGPEGFRNCCHRAGSVRGWHCPSNVRAPAVYACWSPVRNRRRNTRLRTRTGRKKVGRQARHCVPSGDSPPQAPPSGGGDGGGASAPRYAAPRGSRSPPPDGADHGPRSGGFRPPPARGG